MRPIDKSVCLAALALLSLPGVARADDASDAQSDELFKNARALQANGRDAEACPMLRQAMQLKPSIDRLDALASCDEKIGKLADAYSEWSDLETRARAAYEPTREQEAKAHIADLDVRLAHAMVVIPRTTLHVFVTFDGALLSPDHIGAQMLVTAGEHVIVAASDRDPAPLFSGTVNFPGSELLTTVTIPIPPAYALPDLPAQVNGQTVFVAPHDAPLPPGQQDKGGMIAGGVILGIGGVSTIAGLIMLVPNDAEINDAGVALGLVGLAGVAVGIPILVSAARHDHYVTLGPERSRVADDAIPTLRFSPTFASATWTF